jgi:hypothetical protein
MSPPSSEFSSCCKDICQNRGAVLGAKRKVEQEQKERREMLQSNKQ